MIRTRYFLIKSEKFVNKHYWFSEPYQNLIRIHEDKEGRFWQSFYNLKYHNFMFQTDVLKSYEENAQIKRININNEEEIKKLLLAEKLRR